MAEAAFWIVQHHLLLIETLSLLEPVILAPGMTIKSASWIPVIVGYILKLLRKILKFDDSQPVNPLVAAKIHHHLLLRS